MQLILISGKIGSGKSTISKCLQKKGYSYINSDILAKDLILNNISLKRKLQKEFSILKDRNIILLDGVELSIQKDAMNFKTVNWTEYLQKEIFSIDFNIQDNPIRKNKNGLPISNIQKGNNYLVKVIQLENDWIKIRYENLNTKQRTEGWIKWRENNCLLIDIFQIA